MDFIVVRVVVDGWGVVEEKELSLLSRVGPVLETHSPMHNPATANVRLENVTSRTEQKSEKTIKC